MGVRSSKADSNGVANTPQISKEEWLSVLDEVFTSETRALLFTDSAPTFVHTGHAGIVDAWPVNHSEKEFTKKVLALSCLEPRMTKHAYAGTQMIDRDWGWMKDEIQKCGVSAKTAEGQKLLTEEVLAAQWKRMCGTLDRWPEFCRAAQGLRERGELPVALGDDRNGEALEAICFDKEDCDEILKSDNEKHAQAIKRPSVQGGKTTAGRGGRKRRCNGWWCQLFGRSLGTADVAPAWFSDPRTGAVLGIGCQRAAACGLHAVQHLIHGKGRRVVITRHAFEALCQGDFDADGNYEYAALHRDLAAYGCNAEAINPDLVETLTVQDEGNTWPALFATDTLEAEGVLGYMIHVPGHWITVVPYHMGGTGAVAMLCDRLYTEVFLLTGSELCEFLEAMAMVQQERPDDPDGEGSAYRVFH